MQWETITNVILAASVAVLAVFGVLGLTQFVKRKSPTRQDPTVGRSLTKVDRHLTAMVPPLVLMAIVYFLFDKIWILNTRPNGSGEPSFPSTHAMVVATIFFMAILALPKYIKSKTLIIILDLIMLALIVLVCIGRVAANLHYASDVVCGVVFALIFATLYHVIANFKRSKK